MHPIFRRPALFTTFLVAAAAWGGLLAAALQKLTPGTFGHALAIGVPLAVLFSFQCLAVFYPSRAMPLDRTPIARLAASHLVIGAVSVACWLLVGWIWSLILAALFGVEEAPSRFLAAIALFAGAGLLLHSVSVLAHYLLIAIENSREAERQAFAARLLARGAEIRLLRAQINPHFLFNSLNSISALAGSDPPGARRMCLMLAGFFRRSLELGGRSSIPVEEEIELARSYLSIEAERFGSRLKIRLNVEPEALGMAVPPLLLQPLVENAVHHGISGLVDGGEIVISARRSGEDIFLSVENPTDPDRPAPNPEGVGLANVRARIEALFEDEGALLVAESDDRYRVELRLPAHVAENPT